MTAQNWTTATLRTIQALGGRATLQQVYERIDGFKDLNESHLIPTKWGGRPAFQHVIRSTSSHLRKTGKLRSGARGSYELTDEGRRALPSPELEVPDIPILRPAEAELESTDLKFKPDESDRRELVERQIRSRRGQQRFRDELRHRYGDRCIVNGSEVLAVLEAAHISPYRGDTDNHPDNGLLLRSDIHTLLDLNLLGIDPARSQLHFHPDVSIEYVGLDQRVIEWPSDHRPSIHTLRLRHEEFTRRLGHDALPTARRACRLAGRLSGTECAKEASPSGRTSGRIEVVDAGNCQQPENSWWHPVLRGHPGSSRIALRPSPSRLHDRLLPLPVSNGKARTG